MSGWRYCRLCASKKHIGLLFHIKDNGKEVCNILDKLDAIGVSYSPEDELPQELCYLCLCRIETTYKFISSCKKAQTKLWNLISTGIDFNSTFLSEKNDQDKKLDNCNDEEVDNCDILDTIDEIVDNDFDILNLAAAADDDDGNIISEYNDNNIVMNNIKLEVETNGTNNLVNEDLDETNKINEHLNIEIKKGNINENIEPISESVIDDDMSNVIDNVEPDADVEPVKNKLDSTIMIIDEQFNTKKNILDFFTNSTYSVCNEIDTQLMVINNTDNELETLLNQSPEGRTLANKLLLNSQSRKRLIQIVAKEIIGPNPTSSNINYAMYEKWTNLIINKWQSEQKESYFCRGLLGTKYKPIGALFHNVANLRTKFKNLGVYSAANYKRRSHPKSSLTSSLNVEGLDIREQDLNYIKSSFSNENFLKDAWSSTSKYRQKHYREEKKAKQITAEQYIASYPALQSSTAISLIDIDFKNLHPNAKNFKIAFPPLKSKLLKLVDNKKDKKNSFFITIGELLRSEVEEDQNIGALLALVDLNNTKNVAVGYRPSFLIIRRLFINLVPSEEHIETEIEHLRTLKSKYKLHLHPFIIAIGSSYSQCSKYITVFNNHHYNFEDVLSAVDFTFKLIWVLDLEYNEECQGVWNFIQTQCYNIESENLKLNSSTANFISDFSRI